MIKLHDVENRKLLGQITEAQLQTLVENLEETSTGDQDYYIDDGTIEVLEDAGADPALVGLLRAGLQGREGYDVRWERA
jgi:hypothetical protein